MVERDHSEQYYVATDAFGVENSLSGPIQWALPSEGSITSAPSGRLLTVRTALGLLEGLDAAIFRADPLDAAAPVGDGTLHVRSARLVSKANWDTEVATYFALSCAEHILGAAAELTLPDGTALGAVITDARATLDALAPGAPEHLGYLARLSALRRLRRERAELGDISYAVLGEDDAKDLAALDDPAYATVIPIIDAVLAATEVLRHHLLLRFDASDEERVEERAQHEIVDGPTALRTPTTVVTPFGSAMVGATRVPSHDPAWVGAREAARHARMAAADRGGKAAEDVERAWQASTLSSLLEQR